MITSQSPRAALNKAFLKLKPTRNEIDKFKIHFKRLLGHINEQESEEFHKNLIADFLKKTYYNSHFFINTKGRNDLVIHHDKDANSDVGVIIEAKKPKNLSEMLRLDKLNTKALHELILYFLRERITQKNLGITHLIATNINEWFIFDAKVFEHIFAQNKAFVKKFEDFENGLLSDKRTSFFYQEIAKPFVEKLKKIDLPFTYFDIRDYEDGLTDAEEERKLIALFKIFSPEHLLKRPFANDSNTLDQQFYNELLHILGLTEVQRNGKQLIERLPKRKRHKGSLLESVIAELENAGKIRATPNSKAYDEKAFEIAIELCITWINRILFLKLLEAQLVAYHNGDKTYSFLNIHKIKHFNDLNRLFFQVLAKKRADRHEEVRKEFRKVPYLNSSLFEQTKLEKKMLFISMLNNFQTLAVHDKTAVKDHNNEKQKGKLNTLNYLFKFLDAYDFSSESTENIQEENKRLINAAVLGLIFEKINGYKDGSFFTPSFVTMYMCRRSLRKAVVQRFNEVKNWQCETLDDVYENVDAGRAARTEANKIVNSITICDPSVGSGHFLVSALNEMIAIKSELRILQDLDGKRLKEYDVKIVNDDLVVIDDDGDFFKYRPKGKESQRVQTALFHEKQTIIESCLFGVDINPNSVKICRLRLWIELLKNAYYANDFDLETLPNIDINIKCGNSLVSRFALNTDLSKLLKKSKWTMDTYRNTVSAYRNETNSLVKSQMSDLITTIKESFSTNISRDSKEQKQLRKLGAEMYNKFIGKQIFDEILSETQQKEKEKEQEKLEQKIAELEASIEAAKNSKLYDKAFEWRFEFPEVLHDDGSFIGFDIILGNPPYIQLQKFSDIEKQALAIQNYATFAKMGDIYCLFYEKSRQLLKKNGTANLITSNKWMRAGYGEKLRKYLATETNPQELIDVGPNVFAKATVDTNILMFENSDTNENNLRAVALKEHNELKGLQASDFVRMPNISSKAWLILSEKQQSIQAKIVAKGTALKDWDLKICRGILTGYNKAFIIDGDKKEALIAADSKNEKIIKPILRGRDIQKYTAEFADCWLVATFPAKNINIEKFPILKTYLETFLPKIKQTGETFVENGTTIYTRKKTSNKWFETQDQIAYFKEFEKPKIVWKRIGSQIRFSYSRKKEYALDSTVIATGKRLKYLTALLNSKLYVNQLLINAPKTGTGDAIISVQALNPLFVYVPSDEEEKPFVKIVNKILAKKAKNPNADISKLEAEIDKLVYQLYDLTAEEITAIESL